MQIIDFAHSDEPMKWESVNDDVMGGISRGAIVFDENDAPAVFTGNVSTANNGGFASVRTMPRTFDLAEACGLRVRLKGDGKTYQLRIRTFDGHDSLSYRFLFDTRSDEWITVHAHFEAFEPVYRGRQLAVTEPFNAANIRQIGFLIADKQAGPFRLAIDRIDALPCF